MEENKNRPSEEATEEAVTLQTAEEAETETFDEAVPTEEPQAEAIPAEEVREEAAVFEEESFQAPVNAEDAPLGFSDGQSIEEVQEVPAKKGKALKRVLIASGCVLAAAVIVVLTLFLTPRIKYYWAMHLVDNGDYQEAYDILREIEGSCKDAEDELKRFVKTYEKEVVSDESGETVQEITYKYEFKENYQKKTVNQGGTETVEEIFYDKNGNIAKKIESDMYGSKVTTEYEYDKDGNPIKITASNEYAKLVSESKYDKRGNCTQTEQTYTMGEQKQTQKVEIKNHNMHYIKK